MLRPYLPYSLIVHAALLAALYHFGDYRLDPDASETAMASSSGGISVASTVKRLQDLQTIKELLEESADRGADSEPDNMPAAETPQEMLELARELSEEIDTLDEEIRAEELATLIGMPDASEAAPMENAAPLPDETTASIADLPADSTVQAPMTQEMAAREIAALEAKARETLTRRQERLAAQAQGVPVMGAGESAQGGGAPAATQGSSQGAGSSVRAAIGDFLGGNPGISPQTPNSSYRGVRFGAYGAGEIPPVDASRLVRGRGRIFGAGGEYANRVYLNSWYIIGPFPGHHGRALFDNPAYPPEQAVLLDALYHGKGQRVLRWRYVSVGSYPLYMPDSAEDSVYYGYTEVFVDQDRDLTAWIGVDDDVQIYFNGALVWAGGDPDNKQWYFDAIFWPPDSAFLRDYNRTEGRRVLHFKQGRNQIFFKLSNGPNLGFLSMVLTP